MRRDDRLATAAVGYASAGWAVFPLRGTSKHPRTEHGSLDATDDVALVARWWRCHPFDNIGARIRDGLVVVDLDRHGEDVATHCRWRPDDFPETLMAETGTGWHLWFRQPRCELRSTSSLPGWQGVEVKRHAVTVPPSLHANGKRYCWGRRVAPARMPALIVDAFRRASLPTAGPPSELSDGYVRAARAGILADLASAAGPGNHHAPLLRASFRYRDIGLSIDDALADLVPLVSGHPQNEALATIRSCFR